MWNDYSGYGSDRIQISTPLAVWNHVLEVFSLKGASRILLPGVSEGRAHITKLGLTFLSFHILFIRIFLFEIQLKTIFHWGRMWKDYSRTVFDRIQTYNTSHVRYTSFSLNGASRIPYLV
jgi:hypothetical protein